MKQIFQLGIRRSGNHGVTNLIIQSFNDTKNTVHLNDLQDNILAKYAQFRNKPKTETYVDNKWSGFKDASLCVISFENQNITQLKGRLNKIRSKYPDVACVLLLRNPFNMLASTCNFYMKTMTGYRLHILNNILQIKTLWIKYAKEMLNADKKQKPPPSRWDNVPARERPSNWKSFVNPVVSKKPLFIPIIYSKFYKDKAYRHTCLQKMGIKCNDDHLDTVYQWGWSSFDAPSDKVKNYEDLFCRYKKYSNDPWFKKNIMEDTQLKNLWNKICVKFSLTNEIVK